MLECVVNLSEGRDGARLDACVRAGGTDVLDVHTDAHHNRSVLTLVGEQAPRHVAEAAVAQLDLRHHEGVHPRLGVVDVVPFVALGASSVAAASSVADAIDARNDFAHWLAGEHGVPCFLYGPERTLPDVRRHAFRSLSPDVGPARPHPTAGATAVGARPALVAYNVWLEPPDLALARRIASAVRGPSVRALGLPVGARVQVSMNLIDPAACGPGDAYDLVERTATSLGGRADGAELVGLLPDAVLRAIDPTRWAALDLGPDRTVEARLAARA